MKDISEVMLDRLLMQAEELCDLRTAINQWNHKTEWASDVYEEVTFETNIHPADIIKLYVDKLKAQIADQRKSLDEIRADDVAEYKRWKWAVDLRSESDDQKAGAHLADWMKAHVDSLTAENAKLEQQLAIVQERELLAYMKQRGRGVKH